ncbi:hypothetical protein EDC04DRAFT_2650058, partial [Pisolithus marmoratus]
MMHIYLGDADCVECWFKSLFIFGRYYAILYLIGYFAGMRSSPLLDPTVLITFQFTIAMAYLCPCTHPYGSVWQILTVSS